MQAATSAQVTTALSLLAPNGEAGIAGLLAGGAQVKPGQAKPGDATQAPGADAFAQMLAAALGMIAPLAQDQAQTQTQTQTQTQAQTGDASAAAGSIASAVAAPVAANPAQPVAPASSKVSTPSKDAQPAGASALVAAAADAATAVLTGQVGAADAKAKPAPATQTPAQAPGAAQVETQAQIQAQPQGSSLPAPAQATQGPAVATAMTAAVTAPPAPEPVPAAALAVQTQQPDPMADASAAPPPSRTPAAQTLGTGALQNAGQAATAPVLAATAPVQAKPGDDAPGQPAAPAQPSASTAVVLATAADAAKSDGQNASGQTPDGSNGDASQQGSARLDATTAGAGFAAGAPPPIAAAQTSALALAQATPQTVTRLAADIASKLGSKSTRFDVALEPAGLGRVDVKVHIGADGVMTAALNFDTSHAAEALKARSGELRAALEQAGFSLGGGALSFTGGGSGGAGGSSGGNPSGQAWSRNVADPAAQAADTAPIALAAASRAGGVDVRI